MTDTVDYEALVDQRQRQLAQGAIAGTEGVNPQDAATAIQHGPSADVTPSVGMYQPQQVQAQAKQQQQQQALQNPGVASWTAQAAPEHVAAAKDDLGSLAEVQRRLDPYSDYHPASIGAALSDTFALIRQQYQQGQAAYNQALKEKKQGQLLPSLGHAAEGAFAGLTAFIAPLQNAVQGSAYQAAKALGANEEQARGIGDVFATDFLSDTGERAALAYPTGPAQRLAGAGSGEAGGEAAPAFVPPHQPTPGGNFATNGEGVVVDAQGQPVHFPDKRSAALWTLANRTDGQWFDVGGNGPGGSRFVVDTGPRPGSGAVVPPGVGADAAADELRATVAEADVAHTQAVREAVEASPITERSPPTMADFIEHQMLGRMVSVEPETLIELAQQGHDLSGLGVGQDVARALVSGDAVQIPYSRYVTASAGQPWAQALDKATTFREGGVSVEQAKEAPQPVEAAPRQPAAVPADLTAEEGDRFRTLAAQAETAVDQVFREQYLTPMPIEHASALGMTEDEMARYGDAMRAASEEARARAVDAVVRQIKRERKPDWQAAVAKHTEALAAEIEQLPAVKAMRALSEPGFKLNTDLVNNFYPEPASRLPKGVLHAKGNNPDDAAELLGYGSGAELVSELADLHEAVQASGAKGLSAYVAKQAKAGAVSRAEQELGEGFFNPEAMHELAMSMVPADKAEGVLEMELRDLAQRSGGSFNLQLLKQRAKANFQSARVGDVVNAQKLNERIRRLGEKTERALQKGHYGAAFGYKQVQFLKRLQLREALPFQKQLRRTLGQWKDLASARSIATVDQTALNVVHTIQAEMGYAVNSHPNDLAFPQGGYASRQEYIDARNASGAEIPDTTGVPARNPADSTRKYIADLTVGQFNTLHDHIASLVTDGRNQRTVTRAGQKVELDAQVAQGVLELESRSRDIDVYDKSLGSYPDRLRRGLDAWLVRNEQLMIDFARGNPDSPFFQIVSRQLAERTGWADDWRMTLATHFREVGKALRKEHQDWIKARLPDNPFAGTGFLPVARKNGSPLFQTNKDITMAALHMGDAQALQKLADGYDTTPAAIEAVVHKFATDAMWTAVEGVWAGFQKLAPEIEAANLRRKGVSLKMVEPRPFVTPSGRKIAGGYFPVSYDYDALPERFKTIITGDGMLGAQEYYSALPNNDRMKARTGFSSPIDMDFDLVHYKFNQMIHDLAYREVLQDMQKFLLHPEMTKAIGRKYGPEYVQKLRGDITAIAGAETTGTNEARVVSQAMANLTNAMQVALVGFNPNTVVKHMLTAGFHSMQTVGPAAFAQASLQLLQGGAALRVQLNAESAELRYRSLNADEGSREAIEALDGNNNTGRKVVRASYSPISALDKASAYQVYIAAKQAELDRQAALGRPLDEAQAIAVADQAVRQAHGSAGITSQPAALRAGRDIPGQVYRAATRFMTFMNHNYNRMRGLGQALGFGSGEVDLGEAASILFTYHILTGAVNVLMAGGLAGLVLGGIALAEGRNKEIGNPLNWVEGLGHALEHTYFGGVPVASDIEGWAAWAAEGQHGTPHGSMFAQAGFTAGKAMADIAAIFGHHTSADKQRGRIERAVADVTPFGSAQRIIERIFDPKANPQRRNH